MQSFFSQNRLVFLEHTSVRPAKAIVTGTRTRSGTYQVNFRPSESRSCIALCSKKRQFNLNASVISMKTQNFKVKHHKFSSYYLAYIAFTALAVYETEHVMSNLY